MKGPALKHRERGFTLLELLVVVALIGIMLTVVVTSVGDGGRQKQLENEARRLAAVARLARDEAVLMAQELSMIIEPNKYDFHILGEQRWQPLEDERSLTRHELPEGMSLELELESYRFTPKRKTDTEETKSKDNIKGTRLYFLSSGEVQPFTLYIKDTLNPDAKRYKVEVDDQGEIRWQGPLDEGVI